MRTSRPRAFWYVPGVLYDLVFGRILRGVRRWIAAEVARQELFPWLDVCCGTGSQFRTPEAGRDPGPAIGLDNSAGMVRYAAARAPGFFFVRGDAARLPFKDGSFRAVSVSFGLHDKSPAARSELLSEARRVLAADGRLIAADFEPAWSTTSRVGALGVRAVERLAGGAHYRNGRAFLRQGGLRALIRECGFEEALRREVEVGSLGVVVARAVERTSCDSGPGKL
jgi:ubiquinone/menaquinone biosynthesis C-methylase UbiE